MKTRNRQQSQPDKRKQDFNFQFTKDQIIAQDKGGKPVLYKVVEDMKTNDQRSKLKVVELEEVEQKKGKIVFKEGEEKLVPVKDQLKNVDDQPEIKQVKPKGRSKSVHSTFTFNQNLLEDLAAEAKKKTAIQPQKGKSKKAQPPSESQSEESGVENSDEESERPKQKKPAIKKGVKQVKEVKEVKEVKIAKSPAKRGKSTQKNESESEEPEIQSQSESESQSQKKKPGKGSKQKPKKLPTKFVKGKYNPNYKEEVTICEQFEGTQQKFIERGSIKMNNKELIRAAKIGSLKLMEDIFTKHNLKISDLFERWGPENDKSAIEIIFERQDKKMLQTLLGVINNIKMGSTPGCSLKEIQTGYNDKYAYGTRTRKVALGRGSREGNNAFVYDLNNERAWGQYMINKLMQIDTNPELFDIISAKLGGNMQNQFYELIVTAVRCGNYKTAGHLLSQAFKKGSFYGFNQVHVDVLTETNPNKLGQIKKPSATKKTTGQYLFTPIHCAAINPNSGFLAKLLEISQEYNILDEIHRKPVHYAAVSETDACLQYLINNGIDAREGDRNKTTPLMLAAQFGRSHNVELLAANNINGKNRDGNAAIHFAAMNGHIETIKVLLKHGALINQPGQSRMTPLILASANGHFDLVKFLHEEGAKILMKDKFGRSSLVMAARNGNLKILNYLLKFGADFNQGDSSKNTPLHYAAAYGFPECIDHLIKAGADQNQFNSWKLTPLSVALQKNHFGVVKGLLNYESTDVNCKDDEGRTLVSSSLSKFTADSFEYIRFLIVEKSADVTITDLKGRTPLHYAVEISKKNVKQYYNKWHEISREERKQIKISYWKLVQELLELLISHGCDVNQQDSNGQTPFITALVQQNFDTSELLMSISKPTFDSIDKQDRNILHQLIESGLYLKEKGQKILMNILNQLNQSYITQLDEFGYSPLLFFVMKYTKETQGNFTRIFNKKVAQIQQIKMEEEIKKIDETMIDEEKHQQSQKSQSLVQDELDEEEQDYDDDEEDEEGEGEGESEEEESIKVRKKTVLKARIIQTARFGARQNPIFGQPTSGGLFGQQQLQTQFDSNNVHGKWHQKTCYYKNKTFVVSLDLQEHNQLVKDSQQDARQLEEQVLKLYRRMIQLGAKTNQVVEKRKKFREQTVESELNENPYTEDGRKGIAHFVFENYQSVRFLKDLLEIDSFDLNKPNYKGTYPIHLFAQNCINQQINQQEEETPFKLLESFIDQLNINVKDEQKNTPLSILASRYDNSLDQFIKFLIKNGANINNVNKDNVVPLQKWVKSGNLKVVEKFVSEYAADPNFVDNDKRNSLHHAINKSNAQADASFEMEQLLLNFGARADMKDKLLRTPLFYAFTKIGRENEKSEIDPFETVSSILANENCEVNVLDKFNRSPLHYAALRGSVISGRYMIKLKAESDNPDKYGNTPLALSLIAGHSNFCTMMIDNKANIHRIAYIIDFKKLEEEEKKKRDERRALGEEILSDNDDKQEDEQEDNYNNNGFNHFGGGSMFGQKAPRRMMNTTSLFSLQSQPQAPQPTSFQPGQYSFFKLAIKHGWQGVAYLLISDGYDLQRAIEDAMMEGQFKLVRTLLMKVKDDNVVRKTNNDGNNLFHIYAMKGKGASTEVDLLIADELIRRGVDKFAKNNINKTPLHYCSENDFFRLTKYLLEKSADPNSYDDDVNTPFTISLQKNFQSILAETVLNMWCAANVNLNLKFKVFKKNYELSPFMYIIQEHHYEDPITLTKFIDAGSDINQTNQNGETALIIAIKNNSSKLVNFILSNRTFIKEKHAFDSMHKTPIHHVVQPLEFGSYENVEILERLIPLFDYNAVDNYGRTPLDYANDQDSGVMAKVLKKFDAVESKQQRQRRLPTSIVAQAEWVDEEIDIESDASKYIESQGNVIDDTKQDPRCEVDKFSHSQGKVEVYVDPEVGPYSLLMTKVDVQNGLYSENVFYKMQVLHEINRNVYILFTRWGRIGTEGQHQMTPFESAEMAVKEYHKIFSNKAGNDWVKVTKGEEQFEHKPGKYQLMTVANQKNYKTLLLPFDFSKKSPYPATKLEPTIRRVILQFTQVKLYQRDLEQFHIDLDFMPLERLNRSQIEKAKALLNEISDLVDDLAILRKHANIDIKTVSKIQNEICEKSSRFYELIPQREMRSEPLPALESKEVILQKLLLMETLLNFEITSKILLGAHLHKMSLNPLTYCFNSLNIRMLTLPKEHPEFKLISTYVKQSEQIQISNIFAIERRGEAERFEPNKQLGNRMLLWHGSKISNFMGILAQGLKVAPPWAFNTGAMFGKGIYFADMFQKSYAYTQDWSLHFNSYNGLFQESGMGRGGGFQRGRQTAVKDEQEDIQRYRYMLLCEVALGKSKELYNAEYVTDLDKQYSSVKGCGSSGPDYKQSIVLSNGCKVPVGNIIAYEQPNKKDKSGEKQRFYLSHNEYIVYDETKVKQRYLVQIDTKDSIDQY